LAEQFETILGKVAVRDIENDAQLKNSDYE
jgi:sialic acid synthase SpsE